MYKNFTMVKIVMKFKIKYTNRVTQIIKHT